MAHKLIEQLQSIKQQIREHGATAAKEHAAQFFEANPEVVAIRWEQYAPYFNDGEPCVFSVNEPSFAFAADFPLASVGLSEDDHEDSDSDSDSDGNDMFFFDLWRIKSRSRKKDDAMKRAKELVKAIDTFHEEMRAAEELYEAAYGNDAKVTITRNGSVTVDESNHD